MTVSEANGHSIQAACNCGAVAFEIDAEIADVYVCHCSICRKSSGSNGVAVVLVDTDAFRWTRGEQHIATWRKSDADWQNWFCSICGSRVPGTNDESRMFVPAGLLPDEQLRVVHHIFTDSKAALDEIGDAGKQHREGFTG